MGASLNLNLNIEQLCPECHRRLVYVAIVVHGYRIDAWACDCQQRELDNAFPGLVADIMRAREWDEGGVMVGVTHGEP